MKYRWYLAMALSIGLITVGCVGCGNSTSSSKSNTSTAGEVTESIEEDTKDDSSEVEADTYTIKMEEGSENSDASGTTSEGQDKMDGGFPGGMNSQFSETDEKITVNVTDDTVFVDETGEGVESIDYIETGMILEVEVDEDGNAVTVTVVSTGKTSQQGGMDMGGKNKQASTEADKTEEDSDI